MKTWDLTVGAGKLELALESLRAAGIEVEKYWSDEAYYKLRKNYIEPLEPKVRNVLDALQRLNEVLTAADHACGME
jgi:hypothetical protein